MEYASAFPVPRGDGGTTAVTPQGESYAMKKRIVAAALAALMSLSLTACFHTPDIPTEETTAGEAVTLPPVTVPDPTDDRTPTDLSPLTERLDSLFAESPVAPAEAFTFAVTEAGTAEITGYTGGESVVVIPDALEGRTVTAIAAGAFKDMTSLKAVSVPDGVTAIGAGAFEGCSGMTSLRTPVYTCEGAPFFGALFGAASYETNGSEVPATLATLVLTAGESIPDYAFYACRGMEAVSLPETLTEIGDFAFYGCDDLTLVTTADTALTTVGDKAFANCPALLGLTLPSTVSTMGMGMLEGCGKLESLTLPFVGGTAEDPDTAYLGYLFGASDYTFTAGYLPLSLMTVTLTEGCTAVPPNAFFECASIREVRLPEGITSIGRRAFYGCERLAAMTLPHSVASIGDDAFNGCIRMRSFTGGRSLSTLGIQAFMNCLSLATVTLPDTVHHLPNSCFAGCLSLTTLTAEGVKTQGERVFHQCGKLRGWNH